MRTVWYNGIEIPESDAKLSIYDSALMYGDMVFEMMRTFNKSMFKLQEHIDRLFYSIRSLQIPIQFSKKELYEAHESLLEKHIRDFPEEEEWRTLINVSRGTLPIYKPLIGGGEPITIIACFPLRYVLKGKSWVYDGVESLIPAQHSIPEFLVDPKVKSRSRQHYKMADLEVGLHNPKAWALLMDMDNFISEGTGSNFFMVYNKTVYTPEGRNILRGITRQTVMDICYWKGLDCIERNLTAYDVMNADEAFFTCTPFCIVPIKSINGYKLYGGDTLDFLIRCFNREVNCDFIEQARRWDDSVD